MEIFGSYTGSDFLVFYAIMLGTAILAGVWIPANLRPAGRKGRAETMEEAALLAGGSDRHTLAVLAELHAEGALAASEKARLRVVRDRPGSGPAHRAVLAKVGDFTLNEAHRSLRGPAGTIAARLKRRGLFMSDAQALQLRLLSILPYALLFAIGLYRQQAGAALGEPTGLLILLLIVTAVCALLRFFRFSPRTLEGNRALRALEQRSERLRRAPNASEAGFAVGLFGTAVLVGTPWESVHAMRQAANGGDSGAGSDSDGGSGCGGGCGGCGG